MPPDPPSSFAASPVTVSHGPAHQLFSSYAPDLHIVTDHYYGPAARRISWVKKGSKHSLMGGPRLRMSVVVLQLTNCIQHTHIIHVTDLIMTLSIN